MANNSTSNMSFLAHVGELRGHLVRSILSIIITSIAVALYWDELVEHVIMAPLKSNFRTFDIFNQFGELTGFGKIYTESFDISKDLTNLNPSGQITSQFFAIIVCGIIIAIPYIIFEIWRFVKPALKESERKYAGFTIFAVSFFFVLGVLFSYYLLLPLCTQFLFTYDPFGVGNTWTLPSYIDLFVQLLLSMGVMFLMPIFVYFLTSIGILTPTFLKEYRKHAFIVVLVIAAVITPNDVYSMVLVTIPLWLLYELSIIISQSVYKTQLKGKSNDLVKN
ncbi:twin-arginine translocase subunit TatC [Empedobacter stercoris]|uniref:Sec-independent protein translocase protein TatC n=1 Tax=Empedobacter stercoris TaxID=1628248 RepID=A0ABX1WIV5_9FLAO|nr:MULTISPECIES: twin-arginine translocase subunit TatC [Empedobacter]HJD86455.1 twin-arginine translocase subunit TatC [Empedobacter falsenii]MCA4777002.1 twin-arginine translocase subunit TatC [Empedobacter stercoris]MCA4782319.1 twin-arginine translocase subunit TatC [Empedobacter stercoris]MCA4810113.1 twin-arginine translocase subunit TatC [Empedobacter stercoris]MDM1523985.1 twin-arginine translocase subunit TatC [Empedobacter sp. 225-1]